MNFLEKKKFQTSVNTVLEVFSYYIIFRVGFIHFIPLFKKFLKGLNLTCNKALRVITYDNNILLFYLLLITISLRLFLKVKVWVN
jgi:hypothetical protein